ncbi:leucine zipper domain-containing protein [Mycolicibacterium vanbaalenii]|uniref:leucine zipper domain-containing protein n=1 Tax=Mycolicibacterium vanbaalenii TaxID=110539 RepID=UPI0013310CB4
MELSDVLAHTQVLFSPADTRLTVYGRQLLVDRILIGGRKPAHVAAELGVSHQCAYRRVRRFQKQDLAGLIDHSSRPHRCPRRTTAAVESAVNELRRPPDAARTGSARSWVCRPAPSARSSTVMICPA